MSRGRHLGIDFIDNLHWNGLDEENFEIYLQGEDYKTVLDSEEPGVEYQMANKFCKNIRVLGIKAKRVNKSILVHMKTCGGDWHEGMAIYHAIKACPVPVIILSYTHARSMSSIILQAADKRVLMPDSVFMIHWGTEYLDGEYKTVESTWNFYRDVYKNNDIMLNAYVTRMCEADEELKPTKLKAKLKREISKFGDKYYTADQAVEEGFADEVFDYDWHKLKQI